MSSNITLIKREFFASPHLNKPLTTAISRVFLCPAHFTHTEMTVVVRTVYIWSVWRVREKMSHCFLQYTVDAWKVLLIWTTGMQKLCCLTEWMTMLPFVRKPTDQRPFTTSVGMHCLTGKSFPHATGVQLSTLALCKKDHSRVAL